MFWLVEDATLICDHGGRIKVEFSQEFVRIEDLRVLVAEDPEGRNIDVCPNVNPVIGLRSCLRTLSVKTGYSTFVRIGGKAVCLDTVRGLTDGSPPGLVNYKVVDPAQTLVGAGA
jgi:hypothetical protein